MLHSASAAKSTQKAPRSPSRERSDPAVSAERTPALLHRRLPDAEIGGAHVVLDQPWLQDEKQRTGRRRSEDAGVEKDIAQRRCPPRVADAAHERVAVRLGRRRRGPAGARA